MEKMYEIKVIEISKITCKIEYEGKLKQKWEWVRDEVIGELEKE